MFLEENKIAHPIKVENINSKNVPDRPGVYRFLDSNGKVIYIGKAKSLIKRLRSYIVNNNYSKRTEKMISCAETVSWDETVTELDALLLEAKLIKEFSPKYNILLKDDKSYPFLKITNEDVPKVEKFRGAYKKNSYLIGPFISSKVVDSVIDLVTQFFKLRTCSNNYFANRSKPCIRHAIGRCSAPCVGIVDASSYAKQVSSAKTFLNGKNLSLINVITEEMQLASKNLEFEKAAVLRDKIKLLERLFLNNRNLESVNIITIAENNGFLCIRVAFYKNNINLGSREYIYPYQEGAIESFLTQFYYNNPSPKEILLNTDLENKELYEKAFNVSILTPKKGFKKELTNKCYEGTCSYLEDYLNKNESYEKIILDIQKTFNLAKEPRSIEIYDNTHMHGANAYGGVVVFKDGCFHKAENRLYKIENSNSDDYMMLRNVINRRFTKENLDLPDLLLIDGGIGQFNTVVNSLKELNIKIDVIAIAKGVNRNAFDETFFSEKVKNFKFQKSNPILFFFERLRDEVHKYVISANRYAFKKGIKTSVLDQIEGIGAVKKKALLKHFGSLEYIKRAKIEELQQVAGINTSLAEKILEFFG